MYKYPLLVCSLIFGIISCTAQANKDGNVKTGQKAEGQSLTWKISGKGLQTPSYLLGTIHMICKEDFFWTSAMQHALDKSEKVCMEMDLDDPALQMKVSMGLMLPAGKSLKDFFTEDDYEKVAQYIQDKMGMPMMIMEKMKPVALLTLMASKNIGTCDDTESYEAKIMKMASESNKELIGLESADDQLKVLENMNIDSVTKYVVKTIEDNGKEASELLQQLTTAYKAQDLQALHQLIIQSKEYSANLDELLYDRNAKWIPVMEETMKAQPTLFAVGAGHLWGEKGVIDLLRSQGYTVEPLMD
jgi:uncharacterized protein YbaP (TraB family)